MSLLIPGPRSPGREIDVHLQPLIEELKELWTFGDRVQRGIRHVLYAWVIDRPSGYEVEYLSWDIDAIFQRTTYGVEVGYTMKSIMHIEKNVCDNLVGTLLNIEEKTKDTTNAQLDLQDLKLRKDLHLVEVGNRLVKPQTSYTLTSSERV
ncbi:transposon protein, putative, CACTA, En/Spm sub-class, expressed [Cucumis melo var. makuwa]|uniref:Transposon protein, putative, CACTA, En/Spm sub-class, expressed n=1 Tax=Cucumis melo var. makuwa TaxID=1194695 RepID=A0A5D3DUG6_CUCMM|nr:transposon protein, putative, CACTA, En/Spm sub-class, expressed [Cucumis melo var. makuwa]